MEVLQVKEYHHQIARIKHQQALNRWKSSSRGYGYPVKSMFYFTLSDNKGYPISERKNGYIAFGNNKAIWGRNRNIATEKYNQ